MASPPSDEPPFIDSTAALASLYQAPFAEFIARRTALATQLKRSGHKDVAARIAAASKPSRAAYLVNQVFWRAQPVYDAVLEAGTAARAAQQARLLGDAGANLAETMRLRNEAIDQAVQQAERVAADEGQPGSDAILAQVRATFEALAAHGREARLAHGHLTADVELPGLAAFAGLILPSSAPAPPRPRFEVVARREEAAGAAGAEAQAPDPRVVEAAAHVEALDERHAAAAERLEELRRTSLAAEQVASDADRAAADAARAAAQSRNAADRAAASRAMAEQDLARLAEERAAAEARLRELRGDTPAPPP